ncbi:MAG: CehA/McbA family metallohydrolase [Sorangiineae bacterium]|nr:CehA/McbA family metallohydrolase [Polyangiaceae bacterium]MEB2322853.1 CehA/McbA family metallohydrolase [Sorangiineae bacterium]
MSHPLDLARGGVRVTELTRASASSGGAASGRAGDLLLESRELRAVIGRGGTPERELARGAVLELAPARFTGHELTQLDVVARGLALVVRSVEPLADARRAGVRVVRATPDGALIVVTELTLARGALQVESVATNRGAAPLRQLSLGDRLTTIGGAAWIPGIGSVERGPRGARAAWAARRGRRLSYALASPDGASDFECRSGGEATIPLIAWSPPVELAPGSSVRVRRVLVTREGDIAALAEPAWRASGAAIGRVRGRLAPAPAWASVEATSPDGALALAVEVDPSGAFELALPVGKWRLVLRAPGGDDERSIEVTAEQVAEPRFLVRAPGQLRYEVTGADGRLLPARLVFRGIDGTPDPAFGPPHLAGGAAMVSYTRSGAGAVELPPGRYRVLFTHGVEYGLDTHDLEVTAESGARVRAVLPHLVDTPGALACDFHLHAAPSGDTGLPVADRVAALVAEGLDFAVATDHNVVTDYAPFAGGQLATATGVEITTASWGHFNAFPYPLGEPPPFTVAPAEFFASVRERAPRAIIQVNHPRMSPGIGYFDLGKLEPARATAERPGFSFDFDTLEVFNGFSRGNLAEVEQTLADWRALLLAGRRFTAVGNSDSHSLVYQWAGYPRTYVEAGQAEPREIARALRQGRALVTTGPLIEFHIGEEGPGSLASAEGGTVVAKIRVRAAPWIDVTRVELWVDDRRVSERRVEGDGVERLAWEPALHLERDAFITVIARGDRALAEVLPGPRTVPFAVTNPIFVDVDGDGAYTPPGPRAAASAGR